MAKKDYKSTQLKEYNREIEEIKSRIISIEKERAALKEQEETFKASTSKKGKNQNLSDIEDFSLDGFSAIAVKESKIERDLDIEEDPKISNEIVLDNTDLIEKMLADELENPSNTNDLTGLAKEATQNQELIIYKKELKNKIDSKNESNLHKEIPNLEYTRQELDALKKYKRFGCDFLVEKDQGELRSYWRKKHENSKISKFKSSLFLTPMNSAEQSNSREANKRKTATSKDTPTPKRKKSGRLGPS